MAAAAKCIFPATFFFLSLFSTLLFFFTFATLPSQLAEPKIVCTALKQAAVATGVAELIAALSQSAKGATSAATATPAKAIDPKGFALRGRECEHAPLAIIVPKAFEKFP